MRSPGQTRKRFVTIPCHTDLQVNSMRFSSVFQPPAMRPQAASARVPAQTDQAPPHTAAPPAGEELPEDLDARVRLIGEWQLGEAC
jgi:hypothetical protein